MRTLPPRVLLALAVTVPGLAACGGGGDKTAELVVQGYTFPSLSVAQGAEIALVDRDDEPHTMTAIDKRFDSGPFSKDKPGKLKAPKAAGQYAYGCTIHPVMKGTLKVT